MKDLYRFKGKRRFCQIAGKEKWVFNDPVHAQQALDYLKAQGYTNLQAIYQCDCPACHGRWGLTSKVQWADSEARTQARLASQDDLRVKTVNLAKCVTSQGLNNNKDIQNFLDSNNLQAGIDYTQASYLKVLAGRWRKGDQECLDRYIQSGQL